MEIIILAMGCFACLLMFLSIKSVNLYSKCKKLQTELDAAKSYEVIAGIYKNKLENILKKREINIDDDIKKAIKYARDKSHPDNGGRNEDFIKFQNLYKEINRE